MANREIKSALEIAMEKSAGLDRLTPAEIREQREKEYGPRGTAIAGKYMENKLRPGDLKGELGRYRDEERKVVRGAFLRALCQSIKLESTGRNARAFEGLTAATQGVSLEEVRKNIEGVIAAFSSEIDGKRAASEEKERERLRALGISGSAVRPNPAESEAWRKELDKTMSDYESRFNLLKEDLARLVGI